MIRWFREWRDKNLKCERVGHKERTERRRGLLKSNNSWSVATQFSEKRLVCSRCKLELEEWIRTEGSAVHSLSMPTADHEKLKEQGYIYTI